MRTLASIKVISKITPIEGKDKIALATIDGWHVIINKNDFIVGDPCIYIEIDSVLPEKPEFEFLRDKSFRIKTMKMAGVISQGICFPLNILPPRDDGEQYDIGDDVTDILGVTQYVETSDDVSAPTPVRRQKYPKFLMKMAWFRRWVFNKEYRDGDKYRFPTFVRKTDETRIQNMPFVLKSKKDFIATEKLDGCSATYSIVRHDPVLPFLRPTYEYFICSRNRRIYKDDGSVYWQIFHKYNLAERLRNLLGTHGIYNRVTIQGECIAPKVQKNKYKVTEPKFYVFNLIYNDTLMPSHIAKMLVECEDLEFVPIVAQPYKLPKTVDVVLQDAHGQSQLGDTLREGLGIFRQDNSYRDNWVDFFGECRLHDTMKMAVAAGNMSGGECEKIDRLIERLPQIIPPSCPISLLHGYPWPGNLLYDGNQLVMIDCAVYYGFREIDHSTVNFFFPVDQALFDGYNEAFPISEGYEARRDLWRINQWLGHVTLFGEKYKGKLWAAADKYL